jgi:uncharacterized protein (DUF58 family)
MNISQLDFSKIGHFEFLAKQTVDGFITGLHKSPYHGFSVEFSEHKQYNDGDSTRFVDWKVFAKTDKLFVKKFEEETNLRCRILLDTSSSMYFPQEDRGKITFSTFAAACLSYLLQKQRDAVGITCFDSAIGYQSQVKSTSVHVRQLFSELEKLPQMESHFRGRQSNVAAAIHSLAESMHKRALVIVFSDMMDNVEQGDELFGALQHLKHRKHEVLLFHVFDSKLEMDFDYASRPMRFVDVESGEVLNVNPADIKTQVQEALSQHLRQVQLKCSQYKIDYVRTDVRESVQKVLEAYLVKRAKMS